MDYQKQAADFLAKNQIRLTAKLLGEKSAPWRNNEGRNNHFRVYLSRAGKRCSFDYFDSIANFKAGKNTLDAYDVLSCCSSESYCSDDYADFLGEYGYEDCVSSRQTFRALSKMAAKMQKFFGAEIEELREIF